MIDRLKVSPFLVFTLLTVFCASPATSDTNLALGKYAEQSGTYRGGRGASRAIDGTTDAGYDDINCAMVDTSDPSYTGSKDFAWWQVDLEDFYNVTSVTIYSDDWSSLTDFDVYISNGMDISDAASRYLCHSFHHELIADYFNSNGTDSFLLNCTRPRVGRYVTIMSSGGNTPTRMTLCEVEIDGYRYYYCDNCASSIQCNNTNGCSQCKLGYIPPACTSRCPVGFYGTNCGQSCQPCSDAGLFCDPVTGECPECTEANNCYPNQGVSRAFVDEKTTSTKPISSGMLTRSEFATVAGTIASLTVLQLTRFSQHWKLR